MTADFLLELRSEEIPARMQDRAREDLQRLLAAELAKAGLAAGAYETYATPRRLALIARGLPRTTEAVREETKGPRASAPPQALEGFLRKTGLTRDQLTERDGVLFAIVERPGRATAEVLAEAIPAIVRAFPWPKSMRWGTGTLRWVRPLQGIVALFGEDVVPCEVEGLRAGAATVGHRFHHPGVITIGSTADYAGKLRACHVVVDQGERRALIADGAARVAAAAGLTLVEDAALLTEVAGLTEWPVPLLGRFDPEFLVVPPEVIQLTMRVNQKYFAVRDGNGALAPAFVCTANLDAADGGAKIVAGNAKVLAARLADARFFWEQDRKVTLADQAKKLDQIVFHEKLGTVADKVDRVAKLARWLVEEGVVTSSPARGGAPSRSDGEGGAAASAAPAESPLHPPRAGEDLADLAEQAARLAKADLVTGMVGEFPELQGVMGGYYARAEGLPPQVADAIRDHYKPVGQGDEVPTAPVTVAVSLADKVDTLAAFFALGEVPTGSRDPFALRRAALGLSSLLLTNSIRLPLSFVVPQAMGAVLLSVMERAAGLDDNYRKYVTLVREVAPDRTLPSVEFDRRMGLLKEALGQFEIRLQPFTELVFSFIQDASRILKVGPEELMRFLADRLKVQQREAGVRHDLIDAVFALGGEDDLVRLLARVKALQAFVGTEDGANLLAGYKRAANILRIEEKRDSGDMAWRTPAEAGIQTEGAERDPGLRRDTGTNDEGAKKTLSYTPDPEEKGLTDALDRAEPAARAAVAAERFADAMTALASLRAPIDAFFDKVTVNDPDPAKRAHRLGLLARVRDAVHAVADFSRVEG